jgi:hypothetical protein
MNKTDIAAITGFYLMGSTVEEIFENTFYTIIEIEMVFLHCKENLTAIKNTSITLEQNY